MRRILMAAVLAIGAVAATACEPAMTIDAYPHTLSPFCGYYTYIDGKVTPADATPKVTLQRTVGGKWQDWKWRHTWDETGTQLLTDDVAESGSYRIKYAVPKSEATIHLRIRSAGGTASPGFYVKPKPDREGGRC